MVKQISDNEIYLLIKYIRSVLWRVVKRVSYKEDARCLKVKVDNYSFSHIREAIIIFQQHCSFPLSL